MSNHLTHIKTTEVISLPDYDIENVRAKIDTGADGSAIWASDIHEADGTLSFKLFGPSSGYYTNQLIETRHYSLVRVKNSFGHMEPRYKVGMKLRLADRVIKVRVTLANRASNRYPVLIGRRTLRGKYLVDASVARSAKHNSRVLQLSVKSHDDIAGLMTNWSNNGLNITTATYDDLVFRLGGKEGNSITIGDQGEDIADFAFVFFKSSAIKGHLDIAVSVASYLSNRHVEFIDRAVINYPSSSKLFQYVYLADRGIRIPRSLFMLPVQLAKNFEKCVAELGMPFILKNSLGSKGEYNYLVNSKRDFDRILVQTNDLGIYLVAQQYIDNDHDYRLLVFGRQVGLVICRRRLDDLTHLNNTSKGAVADLLDLNEVPLTIVRRSVAAAQGLGLQIAGADFMQDKHTKLWYCLEVNKAPQLYGGAFVEQKLAALAKYLQSCLNNN